MKLNKIILPAMAAALTLGSCYEEKMDWYTPDGHGKVELAELPLSLQEKIANYDFLKVYAAQAGLQTPIGVGVGADLYMDDENYRRLADDNFGMYTTGNAMKHESVVSNKGELNFEKIDAFLAAIPDGAPVYGHNFLWHTQQKQQYLKSLIAPEVKVDAGDDDDVCVNIVSNSSFANDFDGYTGLWGKYTYDIASPGRDDNKCAHFLISSACVNTWDCQLFYTIDALEEGVTYAYQFYTKSDASVPVQFIAQNAKSDGLYKDIFEAPGDWVLCTGEFTYEGNPVDVIRVGLQFGSGDYIGANVWIDDFKFGKKSEKKPKDPMQNVIFGDDSDFEGGTLGTWNSWGNGSTRAVSEKGQGNNSDYCMVLTNPADGDDYYKAQACYTLAEPMEAGVTYMLQFDVKTDVDGIAVQFCAQNADGSNGEGYAAIDNLATVWQTVQHEYTPSDENKQRFMINFGKNTGTYYIDNVKFGKKLEAPVEEVNYLTNGSFENGLEGWNIDNNPGKGITVEEGGIDGKKLVKLISKDDSSQPYNLQLVSPDIPIIPGQGMILSFYIRSEQDGQGRISFTNLNNNYPWMDWEGTGSDTEYFKTDSNWKEIRVKINDFKEGAETWKLCFDLGYLPDVTYYLDNVKVTLDAPAPTAIVPTMLARQTRAGGISYILKTPEQKREALLGAMESWIKGMTEHMGDRVVAWDVINEPISDNNGWRGVDGNFGGNDTEPAESIEAGLKLNWDNGHFYWGYYLGKEYAVKAFEYARQYAKPEAKLFVNDYNLEINANKTQALIDMVDYIDNNNATGKPIVDGIGTQMHLIAKTITREQVDAMFQALAATGKLIRITELDVRLGGGLDPEEVVTPTVEDLILQGDVYRMAIESYIKNVPEAQRHGITLWDVTDNTSWYSNWAPCIFDSNFARKAGYKGICDGLAGRDVSEDFTGEDWATGK